MADYTKLNLREEVDDMAPRFGMPPGLEARFASASLEFEKAGMSYFRAEPGFRVPFGHRHAEQEEVYVVISGSARVKVDDDVVELRPLDALRVPGHCTRAFEAGPEGCEMLAFGAPRTEQNDAEMLPDWWSD